MLKINAIKIEVNTVDGLFGSEYSFDMGLNIIRGDNSTGKSTLFQSIIYALGFEELLGGRNEKTMQSTLKDQVEFPNNEFHNILQSYIYLEIQNKEIVTLKRSVISENRKSQLIDVIYGPYITGQSKSYTSKSMYIHDKGGSSDITYGFHQFLEEFLNWKLPDVLNTKGDFQKLYLQQLAPSFIIEQKLGWSDFFATMPYYTTKDVVKRVIEFILNMDVYENEKKKQFLNLQRNNLNAEWFNLFLGLKSLVNEVGGSLHGLELKPSIINNFDDIYISIISEKSEITLLEEIENLKKKYAELEKQKVKTVGDEISNTEKELIFLNNKLSQISLNYEMLQPEINFENEKLKTYKLQLEAVKEDIRKNKGALKINSLGAELPANTAINKCPTCNQPFNDSLLPEDIKQIPMRLEDNLQYLEAQEKMLNVYVDGQNKNIIESKKKLDEYLKQISIIRNDIRNHKRELIEDERLPSSIAIENKIELRKKIEKFVEVFNNFNSQIDEIKNLNGKLESILISESTLSNHLLSINDVKKLDKLEEIFVKMLELFNYQSKPFEAIKISKESYLPVAQKLVGEQLFYNIKFDSSASDFIRCIWAYTLALLNTSVIYGTYHPFLLILDEPKQQDIAIRDFSVFLNELSKLTDQQVLFFASFENSDVTFKETTKSLKFKLNYIEGKLIKPL